MKDIMEYCGLIFDRHKAQTDSADKEYLEGRLSVNDRIAKSCPINIGDIVTIPLTGWEAHAGKKASVVKIGYFASNDWRRKLPNQPMVHLLVCRKDGSVGVRETEVALKKFLDEKTL